MVNELIKDQYEQRLPILGDYEITVTLDHNPYQFKVEDLFQMATRINKREAFFLSVKYSESIWQLNLKCRY